MADTGTIIAIIISEVISCPQEEEIAMCYVCM